MQLDNATKEFLLKIARQSIENIFTGSKIELPDFEKFPVLKTHSGAFVTLTICDQLRGCIGYIESDKPLFDTIQEAAVHAAQHDPRFPSLSEDELEVIDIEISILSVPFPMKSYDEIEVGVHGLILEEDGRRGLLLPQVPIEHKMNKDEYLNAICNKAGFHSTFWKEKQLNMNLFTATVFGEK